MGCERGWWKRPPRTRARMRACARTRADGGLGAHECVCLIPAMCGAPLNEQYTCFPRTFESCPSKKKQKKQNQRNSKGKNNYKNVFIICKDNEKVISYSLYMKLFHQLCGVVKLFEKHKKREKKGKKGKKKS